MTSEKYSLELFPILSLFLADSANQEPVRSTSQLPDWHDLNLQTTMDENGWLGLECSENEENENR